MHFKMKNLEIKNEPILENSNKKKNCNIVCVYHMLLLGEVTASEHPFVIHNVSIVGFPEIKHKLVLLNP